jgi:hypothetical protein
MNRQDRQEIRFQLEPQRRREAVLDKGEGSEPYIYMAISVGFLRAG